MPKLNGSPPLSRPLESAPADGPEDSPAFTPALGRLGSTAAYDAVIALFTRERRWRAALVALAAPSPGDVLVDLGCGTGTLAVQLKQTCPAAEVLGVDPDPAMLAIARRKSAREGVDVTWHEAMGDRLPAVVGAGRATTVVSSLVFHHCTTPVKRALFAAAFAALRPGGTLVVADYGLQRTRLMRGLFLVIQAVDGRATTVPNGRGVLPGLMRDAGFVDVAERDVVPTATGSVSLYVACRPEGPPVAEASVPGSGDSRDAL
ncbi:MAG: methyltransferase domain-containing protein [Gemmatimonadaceae bacterium]|nr:methyltransferase domain-containing protein [Gemmatimonadaceae bacterium]